MSGYAFWADLYDRFFPLDDDRRDFFLARLEPGMRFLDVGCGTASLGVALGERGIEAWGVDPDPGLLARVPDRVRSRHLCGSMTDLAAFAEGATYSMLACVGNTLPHARSREEMKGVLGEFGKVLDPGGLCVIQTLNYDRILARGIVSLPLLRAGSATLERTCRIHSDMVDFTVRIDPGDGTGGRESTWPLLALARHELEDALEETGFRVLACHGGFDSAVWSMESFVTVLEACRI